ncbi:hypothetical protein [Bradyrhizobium sp. WSM1743]|uniref:hypothetical protein n=1 Tax=Bradyrhizobium sp. WSM1743 TaxID=318996 RepID=UPI000486329C|nr:hypothetical protein [Bradyrhizobium sp. WSM1743]
MIAELVVIDIPGHQNLRFSASRVLGAGLLVDPSPTPQIRMFADAKDHDDKDVWFAAFERNGISFPSSRSE